MEQNPSSYHLQQLSTCWTYQNFNTSREPHGLLRPLHSRSRSSLHGKAHTAIIISNGLLRIYGETLLQSCALFLFADQALDPIDLAHSMRSSRLPLYDPYQHSVLPCLHQTGRCASSIESARLYGRPGITQTQPGSVVWERSSWSIRFPQGGRSIACLWLDDWHHWPWQSSRYVVIAWRWRRGCQHVRQWLAGSTDNFSWKYTSRQCC